MKSSFKCRMKRIPHFKPSTNDLLLKYQCYIHFERAKRAHTAGGGEVAALPATLTRTSQSGRSVWHTISHPPPIGCERANFSVVDRRLTHQIFLWFIGFIPCTFRPLSSWHLGNCIMSHMHSKAYVTSYIAACLQASPNTSSNNK